MNTRQTKVTRVLALAVLLSVADTRSVWAHDPGLSSAALKIETDRLTAWLTLAPVDIGVLVPMDADHDGRVTAAEFDAVSDTLQRVAREAIEVRFDDQRVEARDARVRLEGDNIHIELTFPRPTAQSLSLRSGLVAKLPRGHRQYLTLQAEDGSTLEERLLDARQHTIHVAATTLSGATASETASETTAKRDSTTVGEFILLGIEHILVGYDHLLFLFALLVLGGGLWKVAGLITSFTVAHSLTLALATFDVVQLPAKIVEPLIALSIVYVGLENIFRGRSDGRWRLTFAFGLVHGLGFASVLRELNITASGSALAPLLGFNLGVELGQVAIALVVLPFVLRLASLPRFFPRFVTACSALVVCVGSYWLLERTLLP